MHLARENNLHRIIHFQPHLHRVQFHILSEKVCYRLSMWIPRLGANCTVVHKMKEASPGMVS